MPPVAKWIIAAIVLAAGAYGAFFVNLKGKPLSAHVVDVWRSPVMQQKVRLVTGEAIPERRARRQRPEPELAKAPAPRARRAAAPREAHPELTDKDRKELDALLDKVQKSR